MKCKKVKGIKTTKEYIVDEVGKVKKNIESMKWEISEEYVADGVGKAKRI